MGRRIFTNIAIAGVISVVLVVAAMWIIAITDGHARLVIQEYQTPPEFRGNHGPWRRALVLEALWNYAAFGTLFGVLPVAWLGFLVERTRRAEVVAALATLMFFVSCGHFPLFD